MGEIVSLDEEEIYVTEAQGLVLGMPLDSLESHIAKHPDIATTPEGYLEQAARVLRLGRPYKKGRMYSGVFTRAYNSEEFGCQMICTVHRIK